MGLRAGRTLLGTLAAALLLAGSGAARPADIRARRPGVRLAVRRAHLLEAGPFGVGEAAAFTFTTTSCYPSNHAHSLAYFTSDAGSLNGHVATGSFQGPAADRTPTSPSTAG